MGPHSGYLARFGENPMDEGFEGLGAKTRKLGTFLFWSWNLCLFYTPSFGSFFISLGERTIWTNLITTTFGWASLMLQLSFTTFISKLCIYKERAMVIAFIIIWLKTFLYLFWFCSFYNSLITQKMTFFFFFLFSQMSSISLWFHKQKSRVEPNHFSQLICYFRIKGVAKVRLELGLPSTYFATPSKASSRKSLNFNQILTKMAKRLLWAKVKLKILTTSRIKLSSILVLSF